MSKILIDTNVLIYAIDEDSKFFSPAQQILLYQDVERYTTSKNLSEFLAVTTRGSRPALSVKQALAVMRDICSALTILYPTKKSCQIFMGLLKKYGTAGLQVHDCEIAAIGIAGNVNRIATFNTRDFKNMDEIIIVPPPSPIESI